MLINSNPATRAVMMWVAACSDLAERFPFLADEFHTLAARGERHARATQTATAVAAIVVGATLMIGFFVIDEVYDAIPWAQVYNDPANESLANDANSTLDRIGDGFLMGGVVVIVMFAALILRTLRSI